ncbi:DNA/RNA non-specific endonuclease [Janthinobacterium agaricidamnosum]|uniref:Endonuclease n=1 Tax=Janthinobacterium agaricidamnosum NBRC 102515 = DSM 9628 TaxID=1349767 RepID=W0V606_9BURK|nr:DNA/RNA non-specific endonuclease [Janthinobacterium agaricidamnosum]CDG83316.1 nuclease C1 [Janthinobacterium agaricidamnosum NBRC 102515 = DSM 9628]
MVQKSIAGLTLACGLLWSGIASAGACPSFYVDGRSPEILNQKLGGATRELCYSVFGVMHSGITRTPLWSAEHLTAQNIHAAQSLSRENSFHAEQELPVSQRAELADYARSGFDRGHMAPNGDMPDRVSQHDSFTLANIVPQDGNNNRHIWAGIEGAVRKLAQKEGDLYVLTGPAFIGGNLQKIGNVLVPSHIYKVVYSPRQRAGAAYFIENKSTRDYQMLSIAALESRIGINLLPSLSSKQKEAMLRLPKVNSKKSF